MLHKFKGSNDGRLDSLSLGLKDILGLFDSLFDSFSDGSTNGSNESSNNNCEKSLGLLDSSSDRIKDSVSLGNFDGW